MRGAVRTVLLARLENPTVVALCQKGVVANDNYYWLLELNSPGVTSFRNDWVRDPLVGPRWFHLPRVGTFLIQGLFQGHKMAVTTPIFTSSQLWTPERQSKSLSQKHQQKSHYISLSFREEVMCHHQLDHCDNQVSLIRAYSCSQGVEKAHPTQTTWVRMGKGCFPTKFRVLLFRRVSGYWQMTEKYYKNPHFTAEKTTI